MIVIKFGMLAIIFSTSSLIGIIASKKYVNRVNNLKEIKSALNIFQTKIQYTYEPIAEIFEYISKISNKDVSNIFLNASKKMKDIQAGQAWSEAIDETNIELTNEDKNSLKELSKMLGKTSIEGQISEIKLTTKFLDKQIEIAEQEKNKNSKLYRTLGICSGILIVILLL